MSDEKLKIIVTGDHGRDRFIYVEGMREEPANLREAWVNAARFWTVELPGGPGALIEYLNAMGVNADDPFRCNEEAAESIYILTHQGDEGNRRWRIGQAITAGEREYPSCQIDPNIQGISSESPPAVLIDFNQGWLKKNQDALPDLLKERPYIVRTHDPRKPEWVEVRKKGIRSGIWFSPIQDIADGELWFAGNWEDMWGRLLRYLQADKTLWREGQWLHHIVIQISYDGALVLAPGMDEQGELLVFAGDLPGSFSRKGYGAVVAGGVVFVASLVQTFLTTKDVLHCAKEGLARARMVVEEGYIGPDIGVTDWKLSGLTNLPVSSLENPKTEPITTYLMTPLEADWRAACDIVCGDNNTLRHRTFLFGDLIIASPDYARTLLRLASRLETHMIRGEGILSFAIFGSPGSGKTFIANQLSHIVDSEGKTFERMQFNIAQFNDATRLVDAFQQIQSIGLQGKIPFVLWDEFDTSYQGNRSGWLPYFLMPMQKATFFDGTTERSLGKCVFVFIGGTFRDANDFEKLVLDPVEGRKLKGPDFHSRLDSCLTAPSVDLTVSLEEAFTTSDPAKLNRAIIIRSCLRKQEKVRAISQEVLAYLLHVPLQHGARSLKKIIEASELGRTSTFQALHLPPVDVLELHVKEPIENASDPVKEFLSKMKCINLLNKELLNLKWKS